MDRQAGLYERLLGGSWYQLDEAIRQMHSGGCITRATGTFRICNKEGLMAALLLRAARMPRAAEAAAVRLTITRSEPAERWERRLGEMPLVSLQRQGPRGLLEERFGAFEFRFRLSVDKGALLYQQVGQGLRLGPLRLPLPGWMAMQVSAREAPAGRPEGVHVAVRVCAPTGALLMSYEGTIRREEER